MTVVPLLFMFVVSVWALWLIFRQSILIGDVVRGIATGFLLVLAVVLVVLAAFRRQRNSAGALAESF